MLEAILLVIVVVYVFLQDIKSTLIPTIAIFVSIIGTFAVMSMIGFSINLLTLFALVLAIGTDVYKRQSLFWLNHWKVGC